MNIKILSCVILCVFFQNNLWAANDEIPSQFDGNDVSIEMESVSLPAFQRKPTFRDIVCQVMAQNRGRAENPLVSISKSSSSDSTDEPSLARDDLADRLTELVMQQRGGDRLTDLGTELCDLLKRHPELNPIIQRCAEINESMGDEAVFGRERYAKTRSIMNLINIGSGIILDTGKVITTYFCPSWLSWGIVALSAIDGGILGLNSWLDTKIQQAINSYGVGEQEIQLGAKSEEMLGQATDKMSELYTMLLNYIDEHDELSNIREDNVFKILSHSMSILKSSNSSDNRIKVITKGLSVLGSASLGIVSFIFGAESRATRIAATLSVGLSVVSDRFSAIKTNAHIVRHYLNLCNAYIEFWNLIEHIQGKTSVYAEA